MDYRLATAEDWPNIIALCEKEGKRLPAELGHVYVAEKNGEILGYMNVTFKLFVDPLVVSGGKIERVKMISQLMEFTKTIMRSVGVDKIYFTGEGEAFLKFLSKKFKIQPYTNEPTFVGKE